jgi:membrane-bound lytic murein transglycosylase B
MLLEIKTVYWPAPSEREADLNEHGRLSSKTRAAFGAAAVEAGTPDHGMNGDDIDGTITDAADAIANILHHVAWESGADYVLAVSTALERAQLQFDAEIHGDD